MPCDYIEGEKRLFIGGEEHVFLSRTLAKKALWKTIETFNREGLTKPSNIPFHSDDFVILPL